jgi:hypothetical protein
MEYVRVFVAIITEETEIEVKGASLHLIEFIGF